MVSLVADNSGPPRARCQADARDAIFLPPRLHLLGQHPPKAQLQIEPGALRPGLKGDTIGRKSELGREGFKKRVSIDGILAIHVWPRAAGGCPAKRRMT